MDPDRWWLVLNPESARALRSAEPDARTVHRFATTGWEIMTIPIRRPPEAPDPAPPTGGGLRPDEG